MFRYIAEKTCTYYHSLHAQDLIGLLPLGVIRFAFPYLMAHLCLRWVSWACDVFSDLSNWQDKTQL